MKGQASDSATVLINTSQNLYMVEKDGHPIGMIRCDQGSRGLNWKAFFGTNGSEQLIGDFTGAGAKARATRRVLDFARAHAFVWACLASPTKRWQI